MDAPPAGLDHVVINVRYAMDAAVELFRRLGFAPTPRGYHSLGSINHLMVFARDYLELIGLPRGAANPRPEIVGRPVGVDALVLRSADADATYAELCRRGIDVEAPLAFSRPVSLDGEERLAQFRTVRVKPGRFEAGRVYFCEHLTPELVWRPQWQRHRCGAEAIRELVVVAEEPEHEASKYAELANAAASGDAARQSIALANCVLSVLSPRRYRERFGALSCEGAGRASFFGAVGLRVGRPQNLPGTVSAAGLRHARAGEAVTVALDDFNALLELAP